MDKSEEIELLQSLKGDTYFSQFFSQDDIEIMCRNIKSDFPIQTFCTFNEEAAGLKREIGKLKEELKSTTYEWATRFLNRDDITEDEYQVVKDAIGIDAIIQYKHDHNIELSENEINYLITLIPSK